VTAALMVVCLLADLTLLAPLLARRSGDGG
jgi:hypothetical protein